MHGSFPVGGKDRGGWMAVSILEVIVWVGIGKQSGDFRGNAGAVGNEVWQMKSGNLKMDLQGE